MDSLFDGPGSLREPSERLYFWLTAFFALPAALAIGYVLHESIGASQVALFIVIAMVYVTLARGRLLGSSVQHSPAPVPASLYDRTAGVRGPRYPDAAHLRARGQQRAGRGAGLRRAVCARALEPLDRAFHRRRARLHGRPGARTHRRRTYALSLAAQRQRQRESDRLADLRGLASPLRADLR